MENSVDPHHVEWLHGYYFEFLGQTEGFDAPKAFQKKHMKTGFEEMEWGILKRRVLEGGTEENDDWKIGHPLVFPYYMRVGGAGIDQMQIRVPDRRHHDLEALLLHCTTPRRGAWEPQDRPVVYEYQWQDENGRFITDYIEGQDIMAWVSQGPITDRTQEHLGRSDAGVAMLRKMFKENMKKVARTARTRSARSARSTTSSSCPARRTSSAPSGSSRRPSSRWAPCATARIKQQLLDLHEDAWANKAKAAAGA